VDVNMDNRNHNMKRFAVEYYRGDKEKIGFFTAKDEEEVKDYMTRKYGETIEIIQIVKQKRRL
jgi:hypothetical protein